MRKLTWWLFGGLTLILAGPACAAEPEARPRAALADYFPPPEAQGGWRGLPPDPGEPTAAQKGKLREVAGVDWDKLRDAWTHNAAAPGATGLLVIRRGYVVGEWYRGGDHTKDFLIYSSSKSYTSTAFGMILADFARETPGGGKPLKLDTKVCNEEWLPESLPLPDPRKADITVRHLLNMASGVGEEPVPKTKPFESALGHAEGSPFAKLKSDPGGKFHYSNAGVAHLVLLFRRAAGVDLDPFLKERLLDPIGMAQVRWDQIGGAGGIGPYSQGYSGIHTTPREHARFCHLALHRGTWAGRRIVPEAYYDFAWAPSPANAQYGAQWWTAAKFPGAPADAVMTLGKDCNDGFVVPSLDLVVVRLGDGNKFPKDFERDLIRKVVAAVAE